MAIPRLDSLEPAGTTSPSSSRPSPTFKTPKDVKDEHEASDGKEAKDTKTAKKTKSKSDLGTEREQAGSRRRQVANELYDKLHEYEKSKSSQDLGGLVQVLFSLMMKHHGYVDNDETTLEDIMVFLLDNDEIPAAAQSMDFCIRWSILVKVLRVDGGSTQSKTARAMALWIVRKWPELAFVDLNDDKDAGGPAEGGVNVYRAQCRRKHKINENPCTPFHLAAETGNKEIIGAMLDEMQKISSSATAPGSQGTLLSLVLAQDPRSSRGENAFALALMARKTPLETLEKLLLVTKTETPPDDCSFGEAVSRGFDLAVEAYLKHGLTLDAGSFGNYITMAFDKLGGKNEKMDDWSRGRSVRSSSNSRTCRENVVKSLVRRATTPDKFTEKVVQEIIKKDLFNVWDAKCPNVPANEITERLLHMAILYRRHTFVERFVEDYPRSLNVLGQVPNTNTEKKYPLWYNNHQWDDETSEFSRQPPLSDEGHHSQRAKIRHVIVTKMIHLLSMNQLSDILHKSHVLLTHLPVLFFRAIIGILIQIPKLDMSRFNASTFQLSDFIGSLIHQDQIEQRQMLKYEQTLKYVEFPPLDMMAEGREAFKESSSLKVEHDEVFRILDWLALKGVKKIIKLVVPDRLVNPHDELEMVRYVHKFQVEVLNWKVLDMSVSVFRNPSSAPTMVAAAAKTTTTTTTTGKGVGKDSTGQLRELYLYSSGKRAAVYHWFNKDDGIPSLGLERLQIYVIRETCTAKHANRLVKEIRQLQEDRLSAPGKVKAYEPSERAWYPCPSPADLSRIAQRLSPRLGAWLGNLIKYVSNRQTMSAPNKKHRPTRVAILDNGVISISPAPSESSANTANGPGLSAADTDVASSKLGGVGAETSLGDAAVASGTHTPQRQPSERHRDAMGGGSNNAHDDNDKGLWSRIKSGRSFVDSNSKFCPWQFPSDPHGTQMANLICALDPTCEIYVARVAEDAFGIKPDNVAKAIEWALQEEVDIISMSFALSDYNTAMKEKVHEASDRGIVMTCSAHDEGSRVSVAYPANYRNFSMSSEPIIVLAACDKYGNLLHQANTRNFDFKLLGEHIPAGVVPFVKSEENITGSSVATALAAGLCSLILTCDRLAHPDKEYINDKHTEMDENRHRPRIVEKHLKKMQTTDRSKFIELGNFGGISASRIGQDVVAQAGSKWNKDDIPLVDTVLANEFGMKAPQKHSTLNKR